MEQPYHILIVEDEEKLARYMELELTHEGYRVTKADNGIDAVDAVRAASGKDPVDLVLLDVILPGINGMEVLRRIRLENLSLPVIMVTARDSVMDKVAGLDGGADDYITKPFAIEELFARIRLALKHGAAASPAQSASPEGVLTFQTLVLDPARYRVTCNGEEIALTGREFALLKTLLENRDIVMSRDVLLSKVCGYDYAGETNVIDVYVRYLRAKIDEAYDMKMIQTVRGVGYVIRAEESNSHG